MHHFLDLNFVQRYSTLGPTLFSPVEPQGLAKPELVCVSQATAELLDLDVNSLSDRHVLPYLSANQRLKQWQPIAMKYTGHQFGYYNPDLGDGRGVLLAEVKNKQQQVWDLHLKGAGLTPYSRQGDGRAVLRSSIREFLCCEALASLGVPTTRALSLINSQTPVYRETQETGAALIRVAQTHIRFGHFEYCSFTGQHDLLKTLCDYIIQHHYPELQSADNPYLAFFEKTVSKTASLMAMWQSIGFAHGVMNTDNMSILGDTFDFGPFAFMDDFDPKFICNHSDHQGRYAFDQQPNIGNWNLAVLAQALLPIIDQNALVTALDTYADQFKSQYQQHMLEKLGFPDWQNTAEEAGQLIGDTLRLLETNRLDYTIFFRRLSGINQPEVYKTTRDNCLDIQQFDRWFDRYKEACRQSDTLDVDRKHQMNAKNPKYILRNYLAQQAIEKAQNGDYSEIQTLHTILQTPFDELPQFEDYAQPPPQWGKSLEISCSS